MVFSQAKLKVQDNSGVKEVRNLQVKGKRYNKNTKFGDFLFCVVVKIVKKTDKRVFSFKKGDVVLCVMVQSKKNFYLVSKKNGIKARFLKNNSVFLVQRSKGSFKFSGSRLFSPVPYNFVFFKNKMFSISRNIF